MDAHLLCGRVRRRGTDDRAAETGAWGAHGGRFESAGVGGNAGQVNYAAAKAGVIGMTRTLAKEWGRYRVNVNCVAFGMINTRLTNAPADGGATLDIEGRQIKAGVNPELLKHLEAMIPLGRGGTPEEAAGAIVLLCYPESNYISGELVVCGGGFRV